MLLRADHDHDSIVSSGSDSEGTKDWLRGLAHRAIEPDIKARIAKGAFVFVKPAFKPGRHFYVNEAIPACKQALQELQLRKQLQGHRFHVTGTIEFDHDGEPASFEVQALVPAASQQPSANSRDAAPSSSAALSHAKSHDHHQGRSTTPCLPLEAVSIAQAAAQAAVQLMAGGVLTPGPSAAGSGAASCLDSSSLHFHEQAMSSSSHTASGKGAVTSAAAGVSVGQGASEEPARHHRHRDIEPQWASQPRKVSRELPMHLQQQRAAAADGGSAEKVPGESMGWPHEVKRQAGGQQVPAQLHALRERPHALEADGRGQEGRRGHAVARPQGGSKHPGMDSGFHGQQAHSKQQRPGHHSRPAGVQGAGYQVSPQLGQDGSPRHRRHSRGPRHEVERERLIGVQGRGDKETLATPARRQGSHKHAVNQSQGKGAGGHTQQLNSARLRSPQHRAHPAQFSDSSLDSDGGSEAASQTSSSDDSWLATSTPHTTRPGKQLATLPGRSAGDGSYREDAVSSAHSVALHAVRSLPTDPRERIRARKQQVYSTSEGEDNLGSATEARHAAINQTYLY